MNKVEPLPGLPLPVPRARHAASCLNYGEDHPKLLVTGGVDNDRNILGDMWMLDINSGKWREVKCMLLIYYLRLADHSHACRPLCIYLHADHTLLYSFIPYKHDLRYADKAILSLMWCRGGLTLLTFQ